MDLLTVNWVNIIQIRGGSTIVAKKQKETEVEKPEVSDNQEETAKFNLKEFYGETREELGKVVWPSRQQLLSESAAVILMVILVATIIYLVDNFFHWAAGKVF